MKTITFYSYDSLYNPWCGGGGALRDIETLSRQDWGGVRLIVGNYPNALEPDGTCFVDKYKHVSVKHIGLSWSYLISRLTYTLIANIMVMFDRSTYIGNSISIYAPIITGIFRKNFYGVIHHHTGKQAFKAHGLKAWPSYLFEKWIFSHIKNIISSTRIVADRIKEVNPSVNILVSANGYDPELLTMEPYEADPPYILFLGRLNVYMKGIDTLLSAYRQCKTDVKLILAGRADPSIERYAVDDVEVLTNITEAEKRELLRGCLFLVAPSRFEGWGISAMEASAAGKPIIVSNAEGYRESANHQGSMKCIKNDPELLSYQMKVLLSDVHLRHNMGSFGREWTRKFSWEKIAIKEEKWLKNTLSR